MHVSPAQPSFVISQRTGGTVKIAPQTIPQTRQSTVVNGQCYQTVQEGVQGNMAKPLDEVNRKGMNCDGQGVYA